MSKRDYADAYSELSLMKKLQRYATKAGREVIEKVLILFEALKDRDTPRWAKTVIIAALGYFITPLDAIPDVVPGAGYADDLGAIAAAFATVAVYVKQEHILVAKERLERWFGRNKPATRTS